MPAEEKGFILVWSLCGRHKDLFLRDVNMVLGGKDGVF